MVLTTSILEIIWKQGIFWCFQLFEEFCFYPSFPGAVPSYQGCLWAGSGPSLLLSKCQLIDPTNELFSTPHPVDSLVNHKYSAVMLGHRTCALSLKLLWIMQTCSIISFPIMDGYILSQFGSSLFRLWPVTYLMVAREGQFLLALHLFTPTTITPDSLNNTAYCINMSMRRVEPQTRNWALKANIIDEPQTCGTRCLW